MFARFFIHHPIFANVIAIVTMVLGGICMWRLPIEQTPQITPPTIVVSASYPGANAQVVADTVAAPVEQQVNGVEGMLYMSSTSASDGSYSLTVTFEVGTDLNMAQVLVQNRVAMAIPQLPQDVQKQGVTTKKQSTSITMFVCFTSPNGQYDDLYLANFAAIRIRDEISRLPGVGDIFTVPAADYSMRVWLDPEKLQARGLTTDDVVSAIQEQNVQVAAGQVGQPPAQRGQNFQFTVSVQGRLRDQAEFEDIVIKDTPGGGNRLLRLRDIARVELGGKTYGQYFLVNGKPAAGIGVFQLPGANALDVANAVRRKMEELKIGFPPGIEYSVPLDTTTFVSAAIDEVKWTLIEAGGLVLLVIMLFLQDVRAVLVPATTVPVTILGAFAGMACLGFSINMLTMFGLVLVIGIVVDDAIVIVEGSTHHIEEGLPPKEATDKAMTELLGPIIGITLVLMAVFLPTIFLGGVTGQLYRQFALTIAATALISAVNAMTLKPAQCGQWLRRVTKKPNAFFRGFNFLYDKCEEAYYQIIKRVIRHSVISLLVYAGLITFAVWLFLSLPTGFLPIEDQGFAVAGVQLPDGASQERTRAVVNRIVDIALKTPGIENCIAVGGASFDSTGSNVARCFIRFTDWSKRTTPELSQNAIVAHLRAEFAKIQEADAYVFLLPAIRGLGSTSGFNMQVQDRGGAGLRELRRATDDLIQAAMKEPELNPVTVRTSFRPEVPQVFVDVDRTKVKALDMSLGSVFDTMQAYLGSVYTNDFNKFGRTWQVRVQADSPYRRDADQIKNLQARNNSGKLVPLGTVINVQKVTGPEVINRYNLYPAASVTGSAARGRSSGEALAKMEQLANERLPRSIGYEWTDMSYQEKKVSGEAIFVFIMAVLLVYLVLAAQYESWTNPLAVILVVPLGLLGAAVAVALRGMDNNVYTQIGIVLIIALASKNAILIVEYARDLRAKGIGIVEAASQAARRRFRPIVMTSIAFISGVFPLVVATGAGADSRRALGTAVFGGMIASTFLAVGFVPVFYVLCQSFSEFLVRGKKTEEPATAEVLVEQK